tara:strand:+ start:212 stop:364 length:153 start_codon:yes stop_codon:yes gene_type:complete
MDKQNKESSSNTIVLEKVKKVSKKDDINDDNWTEIIYVENPLDLERNPFI